MLLGVLQQGKLGSCCLREIIGSHSGRPAVQSQKGKKAVSTAAKLHPDILEQQGDGAEDDSAEGRVQKEIEITSLLIQRFVEHNDTWDRLQVGLLLPNSKMLIYFNALLQASLQDGSATYQQSWQLHGEEALLLQKGF